MSAILRVLDAVMHLENVNVDIKRFLCCLFSSALYLGKLCCTSLP